jgi:acetaldehyde dehydrogenase/alcohol dehydrogenase
VVEMPRSLAELGISRAEFDAALPDLARTAFADPSVRTNPRIPLVSELLELLEAGYAGW